MAQAENILFARFRRRRWLCIVSRHGDARNMESIAVKATITLRCPASYEMRGCVVADSRGDEYVITKRLSETTFAIVPVRWYHPIVWLVRLAPGRFWKWITEVYLEVD